MKPIKLHYYNTTPNMGDMLNVEIINNIFNREVVHANNKKCNLLAIGSLLEQFLMREKNTVKSFSRKYFGKKMYVWGAGFIAEPNTLIIRPNNLPETFFRNIEFTAVRGEYTKNRIEKIQKKTLNNLILGDPGLLASKLIDANKIEKKYKLGIVPHYVDKDNKIMGQIQSAIKDSKIINIQAEPMQVIEEIAQCETIISTAMHGLIVADSFGIPNRWCRCSDKLTGGNYKFKDYYSVFNLNDMEPLDLNNIEIKEDFIDNICNNYKIDYQKVKQIQKRLIESFPKKI